jgi:hypothetical protein
VSRYAERRGSAVETGRALTGFKTPVRDWKAISGSLIQGFQTLTGVKTLLGGAKRSSDAVETPNLGVSAMPPRRTVNEQSLKTLNNNNRNN